MKPEDAQDFVEAMLRSQSQKELPDDGFTARVLNHLPAPAARLAPRRRTLSRRSLLLTAAIVVGSGLALLRGNPQSSDFVTEFDVSRLAEATGQFVGDPSVLLGLSILGFSFATLYFLDATHASEE